MSKLAGKRRVYKYGTGHEIPEGAEYLSTVVELIQRAQPPSLIKVTERYVWHYFLVEV